MRLRRTLFDWELEQWNCFKLALDSVSIRMGISDALAWSFCPNGGFSVKSFRRCLEEVGETASLEVCPFIWMGIVPPKVEIFLWQLSKGRTLVSEVLCNFGMIQMAHAKCLMCGSDSESINHLFLHCVWSWRLWSTAISW